MHRALPRCGRRVWLGSAAVGIAGRMTRGSRESFSTCRQRAPEYGKAHYHTQSGPASSYLCHTCPPDLTTLARIYAGCARPQIVRYFLSNSCIASTAITIDVMLHYGFSANAFPVAGTIKNPMFVELESRHGSPRTLDEQAIWQVNYGAVLLTIGADPPSFPHGLGGHLVATVTDSFLVDASIDQATNTTIGLLLPQVFVGDMKSASLGPAYVYKDVGGWQIAYISKPTTGDYTKSDDWGPSAERTAVVDSIISRIDRALAAAT